MEEVPGGRYHLPHAEWSRSSRTSQGPPDGVRYAVPAASLTRSASAEGGMYEEGELAVRMAGTPHMTPSRYSL